MNTNPIMDKPPSVAPTKCQELPEVLDNYWTSAYSRNFHAEVRCWTSEISALGLSTALPPAQKTSEFRLFVIGPI